MSDSSKGRHVPRWGSHKKIAKCVLVGDKTVGKTSLRKRLVSDTFNANYLATLGVDFSTKKLIINEQVLELQIWDIAGQKNYEKVSERFLSNSDGALLVYDVTNKDSFENLKFRIEKIQEMNVENIPSFIVVGNKIDLQPPEKSGEEIDQYFKDQGIQLEQPITSISTSAKTGENVEEAFKLLATKLLAEKDLEAV